MGQCVALHAGQRLHHRVALIRRRGAAAALRIRSQDGREGIVVDEIAATRLVRQRRLILVAVGTLSVQMLFL
jgi:hypothetical protein